MNPVDEAIRESLLESWIYAAQTASCLYPDRHVPARFNRPKGDDPFTLPSVKPCPLSRRRYRREILEGKERHLELYNSKLWMFLDAVQAQELQRKMTE